MREGVMVAKADGKDMGGWVKGVSFGCCGRLGAHAAGFEPGENGYLTYQTAGAAFMLIGPERRVIGSLQLPPEHRVSEKTHSWTLRVAHYRAGRQQGRPERRDDAAASAALDLRVVCSVLSPAIAFASRRDRLFRWRWQVRGSPQWIAFPDAGGVGVVHYSRGLSGGAGRAWRGDWMLTFDPGGRTNVPVLWVFQRRPAAVEVVTYEYMDIRFAGPFGRMWAMPLYGAAEIDRAELERLAGVAGHWRPDSPPPARSLGPRQADAGDFRAWCDFWADVLPRLPDEVDEYYRMDRRSGRVEVRDVGRRLDGRRPAVCPLPPFLAAAGGTAYPVRILSRTLTPPRRLPERPAELYTHYGPYRLAAGGELRYTLPSCPYLDTVLSPVEVAGDRRAARLTRRLRACFDDPKYTYGGDGTYDPDSLLDILHNLRVLAWAAWSLPEAQRPAARKGIVRGFQRLFTERSYRYYREPVTGRRFARDREVFGQFGNVTYDMDWYSGMNLAGLFLGVYFGAIGAEVVRRKWSLVRDIAAYFEIYQDWATLVPWTDMRGELLNVDCCRHGMQGMIGLARLARRLGRAREAERAEYIAARYMAYLSAELALPELYAAGRVPTQPWGAGRLTLGFGGLYERDARPYRITSAAKGPYTLSPLSPEHMLFLRRYGPLEKLRRYESRVLDQEVPGWDSRPGRVYFRGMSAESIEHNAGAYHFYMVDPHLFLRMLVLDWSSRKALGRVKELSGQVIATALAADAPKVLSPAGVDFEGVTWDARRRVLTIRGKPAARQASQGLKVAAAAPVTWRVLWPKTPKRVSGPSGGRRRLRNGALLLTAPAGDKRVCWRLEF